MNKAAVVSIVPPSPLPQRSLPQYSKRRVIAIWAAAALPMAALGWIVNPWLAGPIDDAAGIAGTARLLLMTLGLFWQFVLAILLVRRESSNLSWGTLRERLWLGPPLDPGTARPDARRWLWLALLIPLAALFEFVLVVPLDDAWVAMFPFLAEPPQFSVGQLVSTPERRALLEGAWWFYGLFLLLALFNTVLGEELLFRGVLLPRMQGAFGKWDWLANGGLFGVYHLHQPWVIPGSVVVGALVFAFPSRLFRTAWMGIAVHSAQSVYFALVLLPFILGRE